MWNTKPTLPTALYGFPTFYVYYISNYPHPQIHNTLICINYTHKYTASEMHLMNSTGDPQADTQSA
jgi:hypothetical protein